MAQEQHDQNDIPDITRTRGFFYPRWPLLSALAMCSFTLVGLGLRLYYAHHYCPFGFLCNADLWPSWVGFVILLGGFVILWFIASLFVGYIYAPQPPSRHIRKFLTHFFRSISEFEPMRWMIIGFGGLIPVLIIAPIFINRLTFQPVPDALAVMALCVALCTLLRRVPQPVHITTDEERMLTNIARARSPLYILRSKWPFRYLWPNRPVGVSNPPATGPGGQPQLRSNPPLGDE